MVLLLGLGCAHKDEVETVRHVDMAAPTLSMPLAGARCEGGRCTCRRPGDQVETLPPGEGLKRYEIRMKSHGGDVVLDSPTVGHYRYPGGDDEQCLYIDLAESSTHQFTIESHELQKGQGMAPAVHIAEYGLLRHTWYDVIDIACGIAQHHCDPITADFWRDEWTTKRKRGRLDPCGSTVVSSLRWDTSGGLHMQDGGALRDFRVQFKLQVKGFTPELPPNDPRCIPQ
jgi:hypothetical protein